MSVSIDSRARPSHTTHSVSYLTEWSMGGRGLILNIY